MNATPEELVTWGIIGLLAGTAVGVLVNRNKKGFGVALNLVAGLAGALLGGFLFNQFDINLGLPTISFDTNDLAAAVVGAGILVVGAKLIEDRRKSSDS